MQLRENEFTDCYKLVAMTLKGFPHMSETEVRKVRSALNFDKWRISTTEFKKGHFATYKILERTSKMASIQITT
jgi:hypothetical protein